MKGLALYLCLSAMTAAFALSGCAQAPTYTVNAGMPVLESSTPSGNLNSMIIFVSDQLLRNSDISQPSKAIIVVPFVSLDDLKETSGFGRLLAEGLIHELQVRRWNVVDFKLINRSNSNWEIDNKGDIQKISEQYKAGHIVTGTYTVANEKVFVNAKILDIETAAVISSGQAVLPLHGIESLFFDAGLKPVKIKGE